VGNVLKMDKREQIKALLNMNWSYRAIEKATGIRRETISKYDHRKAAKVPADNNSKTANCPPGSKSTAAGFHTQIKNGLKNGLTAQRIYQDLISIDNASISYDAVKRYARKLKKKNPEVFARIHRPPGKEGQVDFGQGAPTEQNGKNKKSWLFKMTLSNSRHSYEEAVWHQDIETFIRCHENAFNSFGGVPETILLDNLKSGVLRAHLYEPELNPVYRQFAEHYGFLALPCLPGKPQHKGKVESGVGYTQDNALKGMRFKSLEEQNAHLRNWNRTWARTRIHGTTKQQVWAMFQQEKPFLKALPEKQFEYFKIGERTVHADAHVEVAKSYYSVPHMYVGKRVTVHFNSIWVKVFGKKDGLPELIAFHRTVFPGRFKTEKTHLPDNKAFTEASYTKYLKNKASQIGRSCLGWVKEALQERKQQAYRPVQGIISLAKKYENYIVNQACDKAMNIGSFRYHTVKTLCEDFQEKNIKAEELIQEDEIIRKASEYQFYLDYLQQGE
jgi:transposase